MNEYDEYDNEDDSYFGYNRFLLQQLNQQAEKNNFLSRHQTQHSLSCSYQTLNHLANNSWKPQTRHFASSPLSPEEIILKKSTVQDSLPNNDSSLHKMFSKKIIEKGKERNCRGEELERLKHLLPFGKVTKYCMFHCHTTLTKIKNRLLLKKSQSSWRQGKKMLAKKWLV